MSESADDQITSLKDFFRGLAAIPSLPLLGRSDRLQPVARPAELPHNFDQLTMVLGDVESLSALDTPRDAAYFGSGAIGGRIDNLPCVAASDSIVRQDAVADVVAVPIPKQKARRRLAHSMRQSPSPKSPARI
jgi:hypothetical protein